MNTRGQVVDGNAACGTISGVGPGADRDAVAVDANRAREISGACERRGVIGRGGSSARTKGAESDPPGW